MIAKKKAKITEKPSKLHTVEVVKEVPVFDEVKTPIAEEVKVPEIITPVPLELEQLSVPVEPPQEENVDEVNNEIVESAKVPELDMAEPLPSLEEPQGDEVMILAKREWHIGVAIFVIFVAILGVVGWSYSQLNQEVAHTSEKLEIIANPTPSPTPTIVEVKPIYAIWNGSGVTGAAGAVADKLKADGYEVVETKNAPKTIVGSQLEVTPQLTSQRDMLEAELEKVGVVVTVWQSDLPSTLGYNTRIIIGK